MQHHPGRRPCTGLTLLTLTALLLSQQSPARADETIELVDKTRIVGTLVHYFDGLLHVRLPNGSTLQLPSSKVQQILFKLPKPRAELSTPAKTFDRLRQAALQGNLERYVDCHSAYYQMFLGHQITLTKREDFIARLKKEWGNTNLEVIGTTLKGDTAVMKVRRRQAQDSQGKQGESEEGELRFVKENGEWKMILPL